MHKVFTDHDYKFCVPQLHSEQIDYPLIDWCTQYVNSETCFIEIGADHGFYSIIMSKYCKTVYAYDVAEGFKISMNMNNLTNIIMDQADLDIKDVYFLKLMDCDIKDYEELLKQNNYPPFIFNVYDQHYIKSLNYKIHPIMGYPGLFLASDHPSFKLKKIATIVTKEKTLVEYDQIILSNIPLEERQSALRDAPMNPLPYLRKIHLNCPMTKRVPNNPSIIEIDGGYLCNIRCCNHLFDPHFRFLEGNIYMSDHHMFTMDKDFKIIKTVILKDVTNNVTYPCHFLKGIDDLRLINDHEFICSYANLNNHNTIQQCLGQFDKNTGHITSLVALKGPQEHRHEKNWMPFYDDGLYVIYMIDPFILYKIVDGEMIKIKEIKINDKNLQDFRGGGCLIPYKNGWLSSTHQVTKELHYFHRFIWFDRHFTEIKYSVPFYFEIRGIEFSLSMCHSPSGLLLTYSVNEHNATLLTIDYDVVDQYLQF